MKYISCTEVFFLHARTKLFLKNDLPKVSLIENAIAMIVTKNDHGKVGHHIWLQQIIVSLFYFIFYFRASQFEFSGFLRRV